jgi:hypothetical protein
LEPDLDAEGKSPYDFLRMLVEIPVDRRLRPSITTQVKGTSETCTYLLRYERVPYFCFWCGLIGHDDTECEKKRIGVPSLEYDLRLRCSPVRKFERRQAYAPPQYHSHSQTRRELNFSSSGDNSATLGVPADRRWNMRVVRHTGNHIPDTVDAWDGFDDTEKEGSSEVDADLATKINKLNLPMSHKDATLACVESSKQRGPKKSAGHVLKNRNLSQGVGNQVIYNAPLLAMYPAYPSSSFLAGLDSQEMIPPLRGLSSMVFSAGDTFMTDAESILGKRMADQHDGESVDNSAAMVVVRDDTEGKSKKGRCVDGTEGQQRGKEAMEATSLGAAGQLTGTHGAPRQQQ